MEVQEDFKELLALLNAQDKDRRYSLLKEKALQDTL